MDSHDNFSQAYIDIEEFAEAFNANQAKLLATLVKLRADNVKLRNLLKRTMSVAEHPATAGALSSDFRAECASAIADATF